jgi:hypothetical protein
MSLDPITAITDLVKTGLNKFVRDKMSEGDAAKLEANMTMHVMTEARKDGSSFRDFIVKYEGAAKDVPRPIVYLRSLIRPSFTILVGYLDWIYFTGNVSVWTPEAVGLLKAVNAIVLMFWFGERAVKNSGIIELLIKGKK